MCKRALFIQSSFANEIYCHPKTEENVNKNPEQKNKEHVNKKPEQNQKRQYTTTPHKTKRETLSIYK